MSEKWDNTISRNDALHIVPCKIHDINNKYFDVCIQCSVRIGIAFQYTRSMFGFTFQPF